MHTKFWFENLKGRGHGEDLGVSGRIVLEWILGKYGWKLWTGCVCHKTGNSGGHL